MTFIRGFPLTPSVDIEGKAGGGCWATAINRRTCYEVSRTGEVQAVEAIRDALGEYFSDGDARRR